LIFNIFWPTNWQKKQTTVCAPSILNKSFFCDQCFWNKEEERKVEGRKESGKQGEREKDTCSIFTDLGLKNFLALNQSLLPSCISPAHCGRRFFQFATSLWI
jgi:hypothetical protein